MTNRKAKQAHPISVLIDARRKAGQCAMCGRPKADGPCSACVAAVDRAGAAYKALFVAGSGG